MSDCCGSNEDVLITSCAGASDVGFLSDRVARMLSVAGRGSIYCLAGVGAQIPGFVKGAKEAGKNIVVDGCPVKCGKKILDNLDIPSDSFVITELGYKKGGTGMSDELVTEAFDKISKLLDTGAEIENQIKRGNSGGGCSCGGKC